MAGRAGLAPRRRARLRRALGDVASACPARWPRGLLDTGWTAGAAVSVRVLVAAARAGRPGRAVRCAVAGRCCAATPGWSRATALVAVAGCQLCLLQRRRAHAGRGRAADRVHRAGRGDRLAVAAPRPAPRARSRSSAPSSPPLGLVLVLDLLSGADLSVVGVLWALGAMAGAATYFVLSANEDNGLPPLVLAAAGLHARRRRAARGRRRRRGADERLHRAGGVRRRPRSPWWLPLLGLGVVTAAVAYVTGIAAGRRLGSRLASFVALLEVLFALRLRLAAARRAAARRSRCRRRADPGRRRRGQARGAWNRRARRRVHLR